MTFSGSRRALARHRGAAAIEFAFVFPILFLLIYGVIVYSYVFVLKESMTYAVESAAESAVKVDPQIDDAAAVQDANIRSTAKALLAWLPASQRERVLGSDGERILVEPCAAGGTLPNLACPADSPSVRVTLTFDLTEPTDLFPVLTLPIVGKIPPLPAALVASAVVRTSA